MPSRTPETYAVLFWFSPATCPLVDLIDTCIFSRYSAIDFDQVRFANRAAYGSHLDIVSRGEEYVLAAETELRLLRCVLYQIDRVN